ncbi:protein-glutamine gamma-glutamyltransferase [Neobacillus niacini]|uniref:protein-glutamine gamma-glutamyltransferase n=1 Tax=Neobacillus niacini TaxID=86668 RepID=UPI0021CB5D40|nr:protein-glutamine gamma-glutamyltransferase [Neobacillus niacini]MCM3764394.1 protein-glutamine gamma-glutamyltransferase [Neobacillus niacini]
MIRINNQTVQPEALFKEITNEEQRNIIKQMASYNEVYMYFNMDHLKFELQFRSNTMRAARELNKSGLYFTTFTYAFCNKQYWDRLSNGGFLLKPNVSPSVAILDILKNGKLYATDCTTGIAIVFYLAALYSIGSRRFDLLFDRIYLLSWQFDEDLPIIHRYGDDYLPGDVLHFNNPDFSPREPHWRAENVVYFGDDKYYGHGVGIQSAQTIINFLNKKRRENPRISAYLMNMISRPYYSSLLR